MAERIKTSPRKLPVQRRARETVEAILTAAAQLLVAEGYDRASTNRVAQRAGVSIGSLYQYFPSKEALVAALVERHSERMMATLSNALTVTGGASPEALTRAVIRALIKAHRVQPKLHAVLTEQSSRVGRRQMGEFSRKTAEMIRAALESFGAGIRPVNFELAAFVLARALEAVTQALILERRNRDEDELVDELTALVVGYLRPVRRARAADLWSR
ncbi:MAG: TetR/AcrR family transcriptional regulator [Myxococcaceae bacterium]